MFCGESLVHVAGHAFTPLFIPVTPPLPVLVGVDTAPLYVRLTRGARRVRLLAVVPLHAYDRALQVQRTAPLADELLQVLSALLTGP